jgi:thiol:disulfide interchange protein
MKTTKSVLASLAIILLVSVPALAQPEVKVIAVVNHADWCHVCKENGDRAKAAFMENNKNGSIQFLVNDLSNDETKKKSAEELKKFGLDQAITPFNGTGMAYFFNAKTKALITKISVAKSNQELADAMVTAQKDLR